MSSWDYDSGPPYLASASRTFQFYWTASSIASHCWQSTLFLCPELEPSFPWKYYLTGVCSWDFSFYQTPGPTVWFALSWVSITNERTCSPPSTFCPQLHPTPKPPHGCQPTLFLSLTFRFTILRPTYIKVLSKIKALMQKKDKWKVDISRRCRTVSCFL